MMDLVPACAAGKANNQLILDLAKEEDNVGQADLPTAIVPKTGEIVLLQLDGHLTPDEFDRCLQMSMNACMQIYELQKDALRRRYATSANDVVETEEAKQ